MIQSIYWKSIVLLASLVSVAKANIIISGSGPFGTLTRAEVFVPAQARESACFFGRGGAVLGLRSMTCILACHGGAHHNDYVRLWTVLSFLRKEINGEGRLTLPELYMIRALQDSRLDTGTGRKISERIGEMEQAGALARDFARLRAQIESGAGSAWVPYGNEPWLVTMTVPAPPLPGLVVAVSIRQGCSAGGEAPEPLCRG